MLIYGPAIVNFCKRLLALCSSHSLMAIAVASATASAARPEFLANLKQATAKSPWLCSDMTISVGAISNFVPSLKARTISCIDSACGLVILSKPTESSFTAAYNDTRHLREGGVWIFYYLALYFYTALLNGLAGVIHTCGEFCCDQRLGERFGPWFKSYFRYNFGHLMLLKYFYKSLFSLQCFFLVMIKRNNFFSQAHFCVTWINSVRLKGVFDFLDFFVGNIRAESEIIND